MLTVGFPDAEQSSKAFVPVSITFKSGFWLITGKPGGRFRSEMENEKHTVKKNDIQSNIQ